MGIVKVLLKVIVKVGQGLYTTKCSAYIQRAVEHILQYIYILGKGSKKEIQKMYGLLPNQGAGGSARVVKKPNCFFETSIFSESI